MHEGYLQTLISLTDKKILDIEDVEELKNEYEQFRIRLINYLELEGLDDFRELREGKKLGIIIPLKKLNKLKG